jgi:hypothetical protein
MTTHPPAPTQSEFCNKETKMNCLPWGEGFQYTSRLPIEDVLAYFKNDNQTQFAAIYGRRHGKTNAIVIGAAKALFLFQGDVIIICGGIRQRNEITEKLGMLSNTWLVCGSKKFVVCKVYAVQSISQELQEEIDRAYMVFFDEYMMYKEAYMKIRQNVHRYIALSSDHAN